MPIWTADDGTVINYEQHGQDAGKPVLLLLPGLLGSIGRQWHNFLPALTGEFRVILADLRGHGRSGNEGAALDPDRMVQDMAGLLDSLGHEAVHVAGYSLGGYLGLMLALHQPRRVTSLLMHATKFYWTTEAVNTMRQQLDPDQMAEKVPGYATRLAQEHGGRHWRELVRQAADLVGVIADKGVTENMAGQAQCPVMVSVGDRDELVHLPEAQRLSRVIPRGQLLVLPGVRHPYATVRPIPLLPVMHAFHGRQEWQ